jgi:hypothetical protein
LTDYTSAVAELSAAYQANRVANAVIATEVKNKYREQIRAEIEERKRAADLEFARHLARVKNETGIPLTLIQEHVLHTKSWDRWTYWRDLAEIAPERVAGKSSRVQTRDNRAFDWGDDYLILTVRMFEKIELDQPVEYDMSTLRKVGGKWWPDAIDSGAERAAVEQIGGNGAAWTRALDAEIQAQIDAGNLSTP